MSGLVIVGAGHTGMRAALAARGAGFGEDITLIDPDPTFPPYERPPLSKWAEWAVPSVPIVHSDQLEAAQLTFVTDTVNHIDAGARAIHLRSGTSLSYQKILLATGARARPLEIEGALTLRSKADADAIFAAATNAKSAVIIGAGFIGLELAASLIGIGTKVRVIEAAPRILGRGTSPAVGDIVKALHENKGVSFDLNASVRADILQSVDLVIAGIGSLPNTELAQEAGLDVQNGILVDAQLRTSNPDIYAAGDCCICPIRGEDHPPIRLEAWTAAGVQGDIAGHNMVSDTASPCRLVPWIWSSQYDHVLQIAGVPDPAQTLVERSYGQDHHITFGIGQQGHLEYAVGIAPGAKIAKDIRFAMKLIEARVPVSPEALADPAVGLKSILRS